MTSTQFVTVSGVSHILDTDEGKTVWTKTAPKCSRCSTPFSEPFPEVYAVNPDLVFVVCEYCGQHFRIEETIQLSEPEVTSGPCDITEDGFHLLSNDGVCQDCGLRVKAVNPRERDEDDGVEYADPRGDF